MKAFKVFIFGLLYGWFAKFALDRIYRDNEIEDVQSENTSLRAYIHSLEARLQSKPPAARVVTRAATPSAPVQGGTGRDDLKVIKGIGPAIEKKLNDAGIHTFEALARLTVDELENILGSTKRLVKDEGILIAQAKTLAGQKDK
ncbi:MAG TPA: helix-hairpin-helix domain-containing protein [Anaerolineales bacterium]|nr:helix-hairpin-helix domain-containing protein [Anaerolineales bacterium]